MGLRAYREGANDDPDLKEALDCVEAKCGIASPQQLSDAEMPHVSAVDHARAPLTALMGFFALFILGGAATIIMFRRRAEHRSEESIVEEVEAFGGDAEPKELE